MRSVLDGVYKFPVEAKAFRFFLPLLRLVILEVLLLVASGRCVLGPSGLLLSDVWGASCSLSQETAL